MTTPLCRRRKQNVCIGRAGTIYGHDFQPIYDSFIPSGAKVSGLKNGEELAKANESLRTRIFRGALCTRCGAWRIAPENSKTKERKCTQ